MGHVIVCEPSAVQQATSLDACRGCPFGEVVDQLNSPIFAAMFTIIEKALFSARCREWIAVHQPVSIFNESAERRCEDLKRRLVEVFVGKFFAARLNLLLIWPAVSLRTSFKKPTSRVSKSHTMPHSR